MTVQCQILTKRDMGRHLAFLRIFSDGHEAQAAIGRFNKDEERFIEEDGIHLLRPGCPGKSQKGTVTLFVTSFIIIQKYTGPNFEPPREELKLQEAGTIPLCRSVKHQRERSSCIGIECPYRHEMTRDEEQRYHIKLKEKRREDIRNNQHEDDPYEDSGKEDKKFRAVQFSQWISDWMGEQRGSIIEVAGGKGELSHQLSTVHKLPCTLIEPRDIKPSKREKSEKIFHHIQGFFDRSFLENPRHALLAHECSAVIGLHPDQATEPIVDMAISIDKPFAVVPCCVFPRENPNREYVDEKGERKKVVTYNDFVEYLQQKAPGIRKAHLNMRGRNIIVYRGFDKNENNNNNKP
ncbi:hypothetical protein PROFUN_10558 [Planoprotostelium fungivorum]|uniref:C3H1-type domain-containing protein n=1 Tax=Planoprotostelium fungivorum TaxID=1890364 RepID=A0A2P6N6T2_9EUKA|nr:hypothetical protein PROFUN_10558 [Planoprotostelium fungivorum]